MIVGRDACRVGIAPKYEGNAIRASSHSVLRRAAFAGRLTHMKATFDEVTEAALRLPADDKAILAEKIVQSLVAEVSPEVKRKQLAEVLRRRQEILAGTAKGVSLAQVVQEIQALVP